MIHIQDLNFGYPKSRFSLCISDLHIAAAESTAIVGPSGSGKTTLLHLIAGILTPTTGVLTLEDVSISASTDHDRRQFRLQNIGLVFQEFELIEYLTVLDNVLLPCRISNALPLTAEIRERAAGLIDRVGLSQHTRKSVTHLSQGERQRVAICRALLPRPRLLLADEPTGNLDPETSQQIIELLLQTVREDKTTLITVTHNHSLLDCFDRTIDFQQFLQPTSNSTSAPTAAGGRESC